MPWQFGCCAGYVRDRSAVPSGNGAASPIIVSHEDLVSPLHPTALLEGLWYLTYGGAVQVPEMAPALRIFRRCQQGELVLRREPVGFALHLPCPKASSFMDLGLGGLLVS